MDDDIWCGLQRTPGTIWTFSRSRLASTSPRLNLYFFLIKAWQSFFWFFFSNSRLSFLNPTWSGNRLRPTRAFGRLLGSSGFLFWLFQEADGKPPIMPEKTEELRGSWRRWCFEVLNKKPFSTYWSGQIFLWSLPTYSMLMPIFSLSNNMILLFIGKYFWGCAWCCGLIQATERLGSCASIPFFPQNESIITSISTNCFGKLEGFFHWLLWSTEAVNLEQSRPPSSSPRRMKVQNLLRLGAAIVVWFFFLWWLLKENLLSPPPSKCNVAFSLEVNRSCDTLRHMWIQRKCVNTPQ